MKKVLCEIVILTTLSTTACVWSDPIETRISNALVASCPVSQPNDVAARDRCADALAQNEELRTISNDPFYWGGQAPGTSLEEAIEDSSVTDFNPFVWRRMYLSTFTFDAPGTVEVAGKYRVLRMPVHFRNGMDAGEYPYPFWHSMKKWESYEQSPELLLYFQNGVLIGGLRSEKRDPSRSHVERKFDGNWTWDNGEEPRATLFANLFSANNPYVARVEDTYRNFAEGLRDESCTTCHSPSNPSMMKHLELLIFPNQALSGRHDVVRMLEQNLMPPGVGIPDDAVRVDLIRRAEAFAEAGDDALQFEGESP